MISQAKGLAHHISKNIFYIDGLDIFDENQAHLLFDGVHPNNEGYGLMAEKISKLFSPHISKLK